MARRIHPRRAEKARRRGLAADDQAVARFIAGSEYSHRCTTPAMAAPISGATQNNQSCSRAHVPWKIATPSERAGLTDVLVTGIEIRWISVSASPIARGAKPFGAPSEVTPKMT